MDKLVQLKDKDGKLFPVIKNVVFDYTFPDDTKNTILIDGLDLKKDGGTYDILIIGKSTVASDVFWTLPDLINQSNYWSTGWYYSQNATADASGFATNTGTRTTKTNWYYAHSLRPDLTTIRSSISITNNEPPKVRWRAECIWYGNQLMSDVIGVVSEIPTTITQMRYTVQIGNFKAGTRIIVYKPIQQ